MSVRKIHHRTNNRVSFILPSSKMERQVHCESQLEYFMALMLEMSPHVAFYQEQPRKFRVKQKGLSFSTTPDFEVVLDTGEVEYVEVKFSGQAEKIADRLEATRLQLALEGHAYKVKTEKEIRRCQQIIHNCLFLNSFRKNSFHSVSALTQMIPSGVTTFGEHAEFLGDRNAVVELIAHQKAFCNLYQVITDDSLIRPVEEGDFEYLYM